MVTRRTFLRIVGVGAAASALPACGDNLPPVPVRGAFFDEHGWATIDAAAETLLPGARAALAVRYIDNLLSAFDQSPPRIFGGGPSSLRTSDLDGFSQSLPLTRAQELAWRVRIFGSAQTPGGDFNDAALGPTLGYRDLYTAGIATLDTPTPFLQLDATARADALAAIASTPFGVALLNHVVEGTFAAPEYGGNANLAGWQLARYDGDSSPIGHATLVGDTYVDRADQPTSIASDDPETFDDATLDLLTFISTGSGGMRFF